MTVALEGNGDAVHTVDARGQTFMRVLGDELRAERKQRKWTRRQLLNRIDADISIQSLASWENGTRRCMAVQIWQLCEALEITTDELFRRVRVRMARGKDGLTIDLRSAATAHSPRLKPLAAFARIYVRERPEVSRPTMVLKTAALDRMAELCDLSTEDLIARLYRAGIAHPEPELSDDFDDAPETSDNQPRHQADTAGTHDPRPAA